MSRKLIGEKFNNLLVLEKNGHKGNKVAWKCLCDCGNETTVTTSDLTTGNTKTCGCGSSRVHAKTLNRTHGLSKTKFYAAWCGMIKRCTNVNTKSYKDYGGKGITVCDEWKVFENFKSDMFDSYQDKLTIERIENSKGYFKENCKWIPRSEQNRNKSNVKLYEFNGEKRTLPEISNIVGIKYKTILLRINNGMEFQEAITKTPNRRT